MLEELRDNEFTKPAGPGVLVATENQHTVPAATTREFEPDQPRIDQLSFP